MTINDIKKDLYRSKVNAQFSHYCAGSLYYTVVILGEKYLFPIKTTQIIIDGENSTMKLSDDLGLTPFCRDIKGSDLIRWIVKAVENEDFVKTK